MQHFHVPCLRVLESSDVEARAKRLDCILDPNNIIQCGLKFLQISPANLTYCLGSNLRCILYVLLKNVVAPVAQDTVAEA